MPPSPFSSVPAIGREPAKILGVTAMVLIECACGSKREICLVNAQKAVCDTCGTVFNADAVSWDKTQSVPKVKLSATPTRAQQLTS